MEEQAADVGRFRSRQNASGDTAARLAVKLIPKLRTRHVRTVLVVLAALLATAAVLIGLSLLVVKLAPDWLASDEDLPSVRAAEEIGRTRTALLAFLAGLIATAGAIFTGLSYWLNRRGHELDRESHALDREGQVTDRFTKAMDQLGSESLDVRLGGIYALERIAWDSERDHEPVVEILTAFLREHADKSQSAPGDPLKPPSFESSPADMKAALEVLGRRADHGERRPLDLRRVRVKGAHLEAANLRGALLNGAELQWAFLQGTDLRGAILSDVDLRGQTAAEQTCGTPTSTMPNSTP